MSLLPEGYKRLLYIESTGTQWIDTGVMQNQDTRVVMDAVFTKASRTVTECLFGSRDTGANNATYVLVGTNNGVVCGYYNSSTDYSFSASPTSKLHVDFNANIVNINGEVKTITKRTFQNTFTLTLLALNAGGSYNYKASARVYSCRIYNGTTIVRNLIPCINDAGEVGLYDAVNGVFCGNSGTGVFIAGPEFWYDELEYIESSGAQYVDTGFKPNQDTRVLFDLTVTNASTNAYLFGGRQSAYVNTFGVMAYSNLALRADYNNAVNENSASFSVGARMVVDFNKNVFSANGTVKSLTYASFQLPVSIYLFAGNNNGSVMNNSSIKAFSCQIYDNGTLIRDFVPAKLPDGSIGLIDKLTEEFYPNMGTGVFTAGKIKPTKYMELEYIESTGTQCINAGFAPNQNSKIELVASSKQSASACMCGSVKAWQRDGFAMWTEAISYDEQIFDVNYYDDVIRKLTLDKNTFRVDDVPIHTFTATTFATPANMFIFAVSVNGTVREFTAMKLYSCRIYDNDTLVRDYIPIKLYDGTAGLLDKVSGLFYGNAGTGAFVAGPGKAGKYTLLEYIESTGTQYVDTGFTPNQNSRIVLDYRNEGTSFASLCGSQAASNTSSLLFYLNSSTVYPQYGNSKLETYQILISTTQRLIYDLSATGASVGSNVVSVSNATFSAGCNATLFVVNIGGTLDNRKAVGKLYSCQIYDDGTIIRDYIPIRTEHGFVVLYDLLNDKVYENAGTGYFVAGPDITKPSVPTDFVASVNGDSVVLSWVGGNNTTGYYIYRDGELIATTESTIFTDNIIPSISTEYSVSAFNDFGESDKATIAIAPSAAPPAPANLRVMFADFASAQIAWDASVGATAYRVYRDGELLAETESRIFADSGLSKDTEYVYTVTAINVVGESNASSLTVKTSDFTLITDRTAADVEYALAQALNPDRNNTEWLKGLKGTYNATDLNRVEKAVEYVASRLEIAGWRRKPAVKIDWSFSDFPTVSEMQRYLDNIRLLRAALPEGMPAVPSDMNGFTYIEANTIEQILLLLDAAVTNIMLNIYYSNEKYSGEVK